MPNLRQSHSSYAIPLRLRHVLVRPRLLEMLERPAALVVIRGSAGSGKTTALAEWASARPSGTVAIWLRLDEQNAQPPAFWRSVIQAFQDAGALPAEHDAGGGEAFAPELVQRALLAVDLPMAIAVDHGEEFAAEAIDQLVAVLAVVPSLTVGVAVRGRGRFESPAVRMAVDTVVIGDADLEFTAEETAAVLGKAGLPGDPATVTLVREAAGGHPLATRAALAALVAPRRPKPPELRSLVLESVGWNPERRRAFAEDEPLLFEFLLRGSVLVDVPIAFAETILEAISEESGRAAAGATELFDRAESLGLGSYVTGSGEQYFRLLTLARNAFGAVLGARHGAQPHLPAAFAAQWLVKNDELELGFLLAVAGRDYDVASFAAARRFTRLLGFQTEKVRAALAPVPLLTMRRYPLLAMMLALSYNQVSRLRLRAIEYFGIAISGARSARPNMGGPERAVLDTVMSGALRIIGQSENAGRVAARALRELAALSEPERQELGTIVDAVTVQSGISLLYAGDLEAALSAFRRSSAPEDSPHSLHALAALAGTHALLGEMREAAELVLEGNAREWPDGWIDGYQGSLFQLGRALLALEAFDLDAAQAAVDSIDEHIATIEHWPLFAEVQARIDLFAGRAEVGSDRLRAVRRRKRGRVDLDARSRTRLDIAASTLHLASGRVRQAEEAIAAVTTSDAGVLIAQARLQLVRDAPEAALAQLLEAAQLPATERVQAEQLALECAATLRLGRRDAARAGLERLAGVLEFTELLTPLALLPGEDLEMLRGLAAEHCTAEVVQLLGQAIPVPLRRTSMIVLSDRERVVLRELIATGSVSEIADSLFVSTNTVKSQLRSLYRKLGVSSREDALVVAAAQRLLETPVD